MVWRRWSIEGKRLADLDGTALKSATAESHPPRIWPLTKLLRKLGKKGSPNPAGGNG